MKKFTSISLYFVFGFISQYAGYNDFWCFLIGLFMSKLIVDNIKFKEL